MLQHFYLPITWDLEFSLPGLQPVSSHILFFSSSFSFLCPKITRYLLSKALQSHHHTSFSLWIYLWPTSTLSVPAPSHPAHSLTTSILGIQDLVYSYDSVVLTLAQELTLRRARTYCLRNFCLERRKEKMFMKENYRWNGPKWGEHRETNPENFTFDICALMKEKGHNQPLFRKLTTLKEKKI